ncbi:hypothetical protein ACSQ67_014823 [Phaseolus vulgaris]
MGLGENSQLAQGEGEKQKGSYNKGTLSVENGQNDFGIAKLNAHDPSNTLSISHWRHGSNLQGFHDGSDKRNEPWAWAMKELPLLLVLLTLAKSVGRKHLNEIMKSTRVRNVLALDIQRVGQTLPH